jgi:hypothetical protein
MVYFVSNDVKQLLGEVGVDANDDKIATYGSLADTFIDQSLTNIEPTIPIPNPPKQITDFATVLTVALFYKYEDGQEGMVEALQTQFKEVYIRNKYQRPNFITRTGH